MGFRLVVRSGWGSESGDVSYEFDQTRIVIGRGAGAEVRLPHRAVSEKHATIRVQGTGYAIVDEGSTNGTRVNGARVAPARPKLLKNGDVIGIGGFELAFEAGFAISENTTADRTAALARRLLREALGGESGAVTHPRLLIVEGAQAGTALELPPPPARLLVGRGESCDLVLRDADASREHAEIVRDLDGVLIRDLGSKNGIVVNGRPARERRLRDGDQVVIGATTCAFEEPADRALEALAEEEDVEWTPPPPAVAPEEPRAAAPESSAGRDATAPAADAPVGPTAEPAGEPARPAKTKPATSGVGADVIIYVLAAAVLALSIAGLFVLFR